MKLSSFFVAVMVITSANAGLLDEIKQIVGGIHITVPAVTLEFKPLALDQPPPPPLPVSNVMSDIVLKQMKDYSIIQPMFTTSKRQNDILIRMFKVKERIFDLVARIEHESSKYSTTMKLTSHFAPTGLTEAICSGGPSYLNIQKILGEIDRYLKRLYTLDSEYNTYYGHIVSPAYIGFRCLKLLVDTVKTDLDLLKYQPVLH
ncbi:hypothetical protein BASA84_001553 [Batrachochytrium salamandrivorans]|nr:hypothetical protein BASA84_001553 [Batrachochytrium salamandrivorans]